GQVPQLSVMALSASDASVFNQFPATLKGKQDSEIRPKVSGYIEEWKVEEGSTVKKGQVLFTIDRVAYQEAVASAQAAVASAQAAAASAALNAKNKKEMYQKGIISESEYKTSQYSADAQAASLAQAKAALTKAKNDLSFTMVAAPFDGVVGTINFREGSLVNGSSAQPVTTLAETSSMYAYFTIASTDIKNLVSDSVSSRTADIIAALPEVELVFVDGSVYPIKGKVESVSGIVSSTTGGISLRAKFDNPDHALRSGDFANVRIPEALKNIISIPQSATYELQGKKFVYLVQADSTISAKEIKYVEDNAGQNYYATDGVTASEKIVLENVSRLKNGQKIVPADKK
ncbi:MAG: efflux RND transporter periplasmic adaptor subunit, partial [Flavobacteriales bacterium]|nr:efflux RND transporter periplasmic adaptor subunit [Flavobacteriales bacterium]